MTVLVSVVVVVFAGAVAVVVVVFVTVVVSVVVVVVVVPWASAVALTSQAKNAPTMSAIQTAAASLQAGFTADESRRPSLSRQAGKHASRREACTTVPRTGWTHAPIGAKVRGHR